METLRKTQALRRNIGMEALVHARAMVVSDNAQSILHQIAIPRAMSWPFAVHGQLHVPSFL